MYTSCGHDEEPFVSMVINCYNYGCLLPRLFSSIRGQTFKDFEVVIVNDCSTDDSDLVISAFIDSNPDIRVKYIRNEKRKGIGEGQNAGAFAASGRYLMFIDADDWMEDDCLETLVGSTVDEPDRVIGSYRYVDAQGKVLKEQVIDGDLSTRWFYTMQQANLFKRSVYVGNNITISNSRFQDNEATFRFDMFCRSVSYVQKITYNYYIHSSESRDNSEIYQKMVEGNDYWLTGDLFRKYKDDIYDNLDSADKSLFEYAVIRFYYSIILQRVQGLRYRQAREIYGIIRHSFIENFPDYLKNEHIRERRVGNDRTRRMVVPMCSLVEKTRMMGPFLFLYTLFTKNHTIMNRCGRHIC